MAIEQRTAAQQDYLDIISDFVAGTRYSDLPEDVRRHAKYVWMDTVGVIMAGSLEPQNLALAGRLGSGPGPATILRRGLPRCDASNAALANGTAGTFLELDEGHLPTGHPAIYIVPAVLATGEETGATGVQLIEALTMAYEVTARLSAATRFIDGIHIHGCLGVVGAAVGVARLLGFDASRTREAINVASCLNGATPALTCLEGALVRNVYAGFAGQIGVLIGNLVESGFTGPRDGLSETYTKIIGDTFDPRRMVDGLGDEYLITTNYFKMHAACRHLHSPIDALDQALKGSSLRPDDVQRVTVACNAKAAHYVRSDPENPLAAKFSIPFAIATTIVRNSAGKDAFQQDSVDDRLTQALAQRVLVVEDDGFTGRWPDELPARVEIVTTSGNTFVGEVDSPRGGPDSPISYEEVREKFSALTSAFFTDDNAGQAMDAFMHMDEMPRAADLTEALRKLAR